MGSRIDRIRVVGFRDDQVCFGQIDDGAGFVVGQGGFEFKSEYASGIGDVGRLSGGDRCAKLEGGGRVDGQIANVDRNGVAVDRLRKRSEIAGRRVKRQSSRNNVFDHHRRRCSRSVVDDLNVKNCRAAHLHVGKRVIERFGDREIDFGKEPEINGRVGVGIGVGVVDGFATRYQRDDAAGHTDCGNDSSVVIVIDIQIGVRCRVVAGAIGKTEQWCGGSELRIWNNDQVVVRFQVWKVVRSVGQRTGSRKHRIG